MSTPRSPGRPNHARATPAHVAESLVATLEVPAFREGLGWEQGGFHLLRLEQKRLTCVTSMQGIKKVLLN
jgi:hypothetical protein